MLEARQARQLQIVQRALSQYITLAHGAPRSRILPFWQESAVSVGEMVSLPSPVTDVPSMVVPAPALQAGVAGKVGVRFSFSRACTQLAAAAGMRIGQRQLSPLAPPASSAAQLYANPNAGSPMVSVASLNTAQFVEVSTIPHASA